MDSKAEQLITPLAYRLTQFGQHLHAGPVLVALGVVLVSYLLYNVR
jgi:phenylacetate 2-hydroxylase